MTDPDPVTAHGWTVTEVPPNDEPRILHDNGSVPDVVGSARARNERADRWQAKLDLARCIEDAALLTEARRLAAEADHWCPCCKGYLTDVALCTLLDLLTEDGASLSARCWTCSQRTVRDG